MQQSQSKICNHTAFNICYICNWRYVLSKSNVFTSKTRKRYLNAAIRSSPLNSLFYLEKAISTLSQLEEAMLNRGYNLYVERHSSTYSLLEVEYTHI